MILFTEPKILPVLLVLAPTVSFNSASFAANSSASAFNLASLCARCLVFSATIFSAASVAKMAYP